MRPGDDGGSMTEQDPPVTSPEPPPPPRIHEATLGGNGAVVRGAEITRAQAKARRCVGLDVVVCGDSVVANGRLAAAIERAANGYSKECVPHLNAGRYALPHHQPDPRPPDGHTFYETAKRKAF